MVMPSKEKNHVITKYNLKGAGTERTEQANYWNALYSTHGSGSTFTEPITSSQTS